jgi:hypothetical protein
MQLNIALIRSKQLPRKPVADNNAIDSSKKSPNEASGNSIPKNPIYN